MGVRIIDGGDCAALYCSVSMQAFGPVFDSHEMAQEFLDWLKRDPRRLSQDKLKDDFLKFLDSTRTEA